MAERDAFGRKIGEDPLAELGWKSSAAPAEPLPPQERAPNPVAVAPAAPRPRPRRRRRGRVRLVVLAAIFAGLWVAGGSVVERGRGVIDDVQNAVRDAVPTATPPPPVGLEPKSLLRPAPLRAALDKLPEGRLEQLRVAPERIDAQVVVDGRLQLVQVTSDGRVTTVETPAAVSGERLKVDPTAPARIVRTAARRAGRDPSTVSYLVLLELPDGAEWQLFFADGLHFSASASGRKVRRMG